MVQERQALLERGALRVVVIRRLLELQLETLVAIGNENPGVRIGKHLPDDSHPRNASEALTQVRPEARARLGAGGVCGFGSARGVGEGRTGINTDVHVHGSLDVARFGAAARESGRRRQKQEERAQRGRARSSEATG